MSFKKVYKTTIKVSFLKILYVSIFSGLRIRINLILGRFNLRKKSRYLYDFYQSKRKIMYQGELPENIINEWKNYNHSILTPTVKRTIEKTNITDEIIKNSDTLTSKHSKHQRVAKFLDELFSDKSNGIKTVAHIGARIDTISNYFSKKYNDITFHSIDLQSNLKELNLTLGSRKNWIIHNDYALRLFKSKEVKPDMVIMISTSPKFNNKELYEYIEAYKNLGVKFLLFFEPWWALPLSFNTIVIKKPENITDNYSPVGGLTADYHHNYFAALNKFKFSPVVSELREYEGEKHYHGLYIFAVDDVLIK